MKPPHSGRAQEPGRPGGGPRPNRERAGGRPESGARPERGPERPTSPERLSLNRPQPRPSHQAERPAPRRPEADAPRGAVWLYGTHAVAAALANPARRLRRLLLTEDAEAGLAVRIRPPWPLAAERTERGRLDHLLGRDAVHQGAALLADPLPVPALAAVVQRPGPILVLDQVSDPRNVGAILRCAAAFGAAGVVTQERNAPDETGALAKAASGALETVPLLRAVNIARTLIALKAAGFWTVGLDPAARPLSGPALAGRRVALVLGAEGEGMRRLVAETCDELAGIAMPGSRNGGGAGLDSLNVSAAAAVALYELGRQELGRQELGRQELGRQELGRQELGRQELGRQPGPGAT
jgi:23S rRNA (guanosine2251-2'-O)-methyltransferase